MQTINLDISCKQVPAIIHAKQGDVGRKFRAVITDNGAEFPIPVNAMLSVWYTSTSGDGNYSAIGEHSAFAIEGNAITVEMIAQMLMRRGGGTICLVMNDSKGTQLGMWNIPYVAEPVPGMDSPAAQQHYTALSEAAQKAIEAAMTFTTDETLSQSGVAADAAAVGAALANSAKDGYGMGAEIYGGTTRVADLNVTDLMTGFYACTASVLNPPDDRFGGGPLFVVNWHGGSLIYQILMNNDLSETYVRRYKDGVWQAWEYVNPPMTSGVEYRTTRRYQGKPIYTMAVQLSSLPSEGSKIYTTKIPDAATVIQLSGYYTGVRGSGSLNNLYTELSTQEGSSATVVLYVKSDYLFDDDAKGVVYIDYIK